MRGLAFIARHLLHQDRQWFTFTRVVGEPTQVRLLDLEELDPSHRANLIPFLRGNAQTLRRLACIECAGEGTDVLQAAPVDCPECATGPSEAEEWIAAQPLMRRLCAMEAGQPLEQRKATAVRNAAYEKATGYQKVRLG